MGGSSGLGGILGGAGGAGAAGGAAGAMAHEAGHAGGAAGGILARLKDPAVQAGLINGMKMADGQAPGPGSAGAAAPGFAAMPGIDAGAANGDPSALMRRRPDIFQAMGRRGGGGGY